MPITPLTACAPRPVTLPNDFGGPIGLTASLVAEDIHFSTTHGVLTVEKVYRSEDGKVGYGVIAASGDSRERRAYVLEEQGDNVLVDSGDCLLELPVDALHELLAMALQAEDAAQALDEHMLQRPAVNQDY